MDLNETLTTVTQVRAKIGSLNRKNDELFSEMIRLCMKWNEKRETVDRQKQDIEMALDVVHEVDNRLRDVVSLLEAGYHESKAEEYLKNMNYAYLILSKAREAEVQGN